MWTLQSPCALCTDCVESELVRTDITESMCTLHRLCRVRASLCRLCSKIAPNQGWTKMSTVEAIATAGCVLYHCTIATENTLLTCAIYVTCGLIGKYIYFYLIWDVYISFHILYHFNQLDTTLWLWHIGSVRQLNTEVGDLWQRWNFKH